MFEHLVSKHHQDFVDNQKGRLKFYASFFLLAVFIFTSVIISVNSGPKTSAQNVIDVYGQKVKVFSYNNNNSAQFVINSPHVSVFNFGLETGQPVNLQALIFDLNNISDTTWLHDLVLHQGQTQVSAEIQVVGKQLVFNFADYPLQKGKNYFNLSLAKVEANLLGQKASFALTGAENVKILQQGQKVTVVGDFPVTSSDFVVLEQAQVFAYNNLVQTSVSLPASSYSKLADFNLSTQGETVALQDLKFHLTNHDKTADFYLASQGKVLATVRAEEDLDFVLKENVLVKANEDLSLEIWSSLASGQYQMSLEQVVVKGFVSGKKFSLDQNLLLTDLNVLDHLITLENQTVNQKLTDNWNTLFDLHLEALAGQVINIHKLSWAIKTFSAQLENVELWSGDKFLASAKVVDDQIFFVFWDKDLVLDQSLDLKLIAKIKLLGDTSQIRLNFLNDQSVMSDDNANNNFLWSVDGVLHNSYAMPGLPLAPVILD